MTVRPLTEEFRRPVAVDDSPAADATAGNDRDVRRIELEEQLLAEYLPMARRLAARYSKGRSDDDLNQVASLGLVLAVERFDPDRGVPFAGFAIPTIVGELKRHLRNTSWAARVPRRLQERILALAEARGVLTASLSRSPTACELAMHLDIDEESVVEALVAEGSFGAASHELPATLAEAGDAFDHSTDVMTVLAACRDLSIEDRRLLELRFAKEMTQAAIGLELGVSQAHVHRKLAAVLGRLRSDIESGAAV